MFKEWTKRNEFNSFNSMKGLLYSNWYEQIAKWKQNPKLKPLAPVEASLDPIHSCNLKCEWCNASSYLLKGLKCYRMEDDHLMSLINFLGEWGVKGICFTGDTKVKLVNGTHKTFEELVKQWNKNKMPFEVYSRDEKGNIVPGIARNPRVTRKINELVELVLDNGKKIKCSLDHKFMLKDGSYKEAKDLTINDSLVSLYTKLWEGYELILDETYQGTTHKLFSSYWYGNLNRLKNNDICVHHKNFNKLDNTRKNLVQMEWREHNKLHEWNKAQKLFNNHKIISKKFIKLNNPLPIYCLTVEKYHNFALSAGVFVFNCFGGGGESTLHTKLNDAIEQTIKSGMKPALVTNGTLLTDKLIETCVKHCRWVGISVDSATPKTYEIGRKVNLFDTTINNMRKLVNKVNELKTNCDIAYKFLIFEHNQHEIYEACKLAKEIGVKDFHVRPCDFSHQGMGKHKKKYNPYNINEILNQFEKCHDLEDENFRVFTVVHKFDDSFTPKKDFSQCYASPCCIQLCADGNVYLCTLPETEIALKNLTSKQIKDIKVGEEVLTHKGIEKVTHIMTREIDEEIYELKRIGYYKTLSITKEHPILALNRKFISHKPWQMLSYLKEIDFIPAKDLKKGCFVSYRINKSEQDIKEITEDLSWLLGIYAAEGHYLSKNTIIKEKTFYNRYSKKIEICKKQPINIGSEYEKTYKIIFTLNIKEENIANKILSIIHNNFGILPYIEKFPKRNTLLIHCSGVEFSSWIRKYCDNKKENKHFANSLLLIPPSKQIKIIEGWLEGDGYFRKSKERYEGTTISEQLANQLYEMFLRNDIPIWLGCKKRWNRINKVYELIYYQNRKHNTLFIKDGTLYSICDIIRKKYYKGKVYNIEVGNTHSYMSNKICSHNCPDQRHQGFYQLGTHYPNPEEILNFWGGDRHYNLVFRRGKNNCKTRCTFAPYCKQCEELFIKDTDSMCWRFI